MRVGVVALMALALTLTLARAAPGGTPKTPTGSGACSLPDALSAAGETSAARKAYVKALEEDPSTACARAGLTKLNKPEAKSPTEDCERGETYAALHRDEEAEKAYEKALESDPKAKCAKEGLEEAGSSPLTRAVDWLTNGAIDVIVAALILAGILLLLGFLFLLLGWLPLFGRLIHRTPVLGRLIGPRLSIESLKDDAADLKAGEAVSAAIKENMQSLREEATTRSPTDYDLDWPAPREQFADFASDNGMLKNALEKASDISEQAKIVAGLLSLAYAILPITRLTLSGGAIPTSTGVSLALSLEKNGRLEASTTISAALAKDANAAVPDYVQLAKPAAVWTQFGVGCILLGKPITPKAAQSFSLLRQGLDALKPPEKKDAARAFFQQAIGLDSSNWAAYVGLASIPAKDDEESEKTYENVIESLLLGLEKISEVKSG